MVDNARDLALDVIRVVAALEFESALVDESVVLICIATFTSASIAALVEVSTYHSSKLGFWDEERGKQFVKIFQIGPASFSSRVLLAIQVSLQFQAIVEPLNFVHWSRVRVSLCKTTRSAADVLVLEVKHCHPA